MIDVNAIASGSTGNCYVISDGETSLMIEAGVPLSIIRPRTDVSKISALLISHEHQDHAKHAMDVAITYGLPIYASKGTLDKISDGRRNVYGRVLTPFVQSSIGSFDVIGFPTEHDAADPMGFFIRSRATCETLLFATDTYFIRPQFDAVDYLMIEANYKMDYLIQSVAIGAINQRVADRVIHSHFELDNVKRFIESIQERSSLKKIWLLHLSASNAHPEEFAREIIEIAGCPVEVCPKLSAVNTEE